MRIWSIHPKYLDAKGLVALWREALLAKHVLEEKTKGYRHHPQLLRFRQVEKPVYSINQYLAIVYHEALSRGYNFDKGKIDWDFEVSNIPVTSGQLTYEKEHLLRKLVIRDKKRFDELHPIVDIEPHPLFIMIKGEIERWEII